VLAFLPSGGEEYVSIGALPAAAAADSMRITSNHPSHVSLLLVESSQTPSSQTELSPLHPRAALLPFFFLSGLAAAQGSIFSADVLQALCCRKGLLFLFE